MCDNGNLDKFLGLVRSWTLQENLLLLLYQTSVISNCILSTYPLSKKLLFAADGDHFRKLLLVKIQRTNNCRVSNVN